MGTGWDEDGREFARLGLNCFNSWDLFFSTLYLHPASRQGHSLPSKRS